MKIQTFTPINNNRQWQGRLTKFADNTATIDLSAVKQKGKAKKAATEQTVDIPLGEYRKSKPGRGDLNYPHQRRQQATKSPAILGEQ